MEYGGWGRVVHEGVGWGGVVHENNRCYSYMSQMQNDANCCDISLYKMFGVGWVMQGWGESCGVGGS